MGDASEVRRQFHSSRRVVIVALLASFLAFATVGRSDGRVQGSRNAPVVGRKVASGLTYRSIVRKRPHQRIKVLTVDPSTRLTIDVALGTGQIPGVERTSSIARRHNAIAAINATVGLPWGRPMGLFAEDGGLKTSPLVWGRAFAISRDESSVFMGHPELHVEARDVTSRASFKVDTWNDSDPWEKAISGYTPAGGNFVKPPKRACAVRLIGLDNVRWSKDKRGLTRTYRVDKARCAADRMARGNGIVLAARNGTKGAGKLSGIKTGGRIELSWGTGWRGVADALAGNPTLLENGKITAYHCDVPFCKRQPRTGVGVMPDGKLLLVTVDGRMPKYSVGMNLVEFARLFKQLGATSALNLDGGGSTTMFLKGKVMNRPSDSGGERLVSSALLVLPRSDPEEPTPGPYVPPGPQPPAPSPSPSDGIPPIDLPDIPPDLGRFIVPVDPAEQREAAQLAIADPGSTGGYVEALLSGALEGPPVPPSPVLSRILEGFHESFRANAGNR